MSARIGVERPSIQGLVPPSVSPVSGGCAGALTSSHVECRYKKFQKRFVRERVLPGDQLAILKDVAAPWSEHAYVTARRAQGEVRVEENLATNLLRLPLLLFRRRKDGHLVSSINPSLSLCPRSSGIARCQRRDHLHRIRKR